MFQNKTNTNSRYRTTSDDYSKKGTGMQASSTAFRSSNNMQPVITKPKYRRLLLLLWAFPVVLFVLFLGVDYDKVFGNLIPNVSGIIGGSENHWITVLIFFSWVVLSQFITYFLIKKYDEIKPDMYLYGFSVLGFMAGIYLIPQFTFFNRLLISFITGMAGSLIGKLLMMAMILWKGIETMKIAKKQLDQFQTKNNPNEDFHKKRTKENIKKQQAERMTAMIKREVEVMDQMLREQGVDIDALDSEFGSAFDGAFEKHNSVDINDMKVEEEVVEVLEEGEH